MLQRRNPVVIILLSLVTCGLYVFYLIYCLSNEIRPHAEEELMAPGLEVLLCIICFPYFYFWAYKYSKAIYFMQNKAGLQYPADNSIINVILSIFGLGLISLAIMQSDINRMIDIQTSNY